MPVKYAPSTPLYENKMLSVTTLKDSRTLLAVTLLFAGITVQAEFTFLSKEMPAMPYCPPTLNEMRQSSSSLEYR